MLQVPAADNRIKDTSNPWGRDLMRLDMEALMNLSPITPSVTMKQTVRWQTTLNCHLVTARVSTGINWITSLSWFGEYTDPDHPISFMTWHSIMKTPNSAPILLHLKRPGVAAALGLSVPSHPTTTIFTRNCTEIQTHQGLGLKIVQNSNPEYLVPAPAKTNPDDQVHTLSCRSAC